MDTAMSYSAGLASVLRTAQEQRTRRQAAPHHVPLLDAVGGTAATDISSPISIPEHDTSAMDGYAVCSSATARASLQIPVILQVLGTVAAGDDPKVALGGVETGRIPLAESCVEIMTGAIFPDGYDACVKWEEASVVNRPSGKRIVLGMPVAPNANRRLAGSDILKGDIIVRQGEVLRPPQILALASVGVDSIPLLPRPRVGIWSTGKEMLNGRGATRDANGPYLTSAVREMGLDAEFLGVLDDEPVRQLDHLRTAAASGRYDVLITSGAVSKGKFDHVRSVLDEAGAEVVFHGLAIRPGHPVLFALVPGVGGKIAFFGLPGNPGAAAACFRFLTVPYLRAVQGQPPERPVTARLLQQTNRPRSKHSCHPMPDTDCFRHGVLSTSVTGQLLVEPSRDQSPAKLGPFTTANCWIHLRPGNTSPETVECYPISPTGTIHLSTYPPRSQTNPPALLSLISQSSREPSTPPATPQAYSSLSTTTHHPPQSQPPPHPHALLLHPDPKPPQYQSPSPPTP